MKTLLILLVLAFIPAQTIAHDDDYITDWLCYRDCMERGGTYAICKRMCSY